MRGAPRCHSERSEASPAHFVIPNEVRNPTRACSVRPCFLCGARLTIDPVASLCSAGQLVGFRSGGFDWAQPPYSFLSFRLSTGLKGQTQ